MFNGLIESQRARETGIASRVVSIGAHAMVLGAAVYATVGAAPAPVEITIFHTLPVYVAPRPPRGSGPVTSTPCAGPLCVPRPPVLTIDVAMPDVPDGPPIDLPGAIFAPGGGDPGAPTGGAPGSDPGTGVFELAERPAAALPGNPRPVYPALLRSARIEATVTARYIVDTTGRVEPASISFGPAGERLFEESVRRALFVSRFSPAETQGHRVRMLVRQDFAFRLTP